MKLLRIVVCFNLLSFFGFTQNLKKSTNQKKIIITGKVMQSNSYCGGMEPTPEMEAEYSKERPYAKKVFL